MADSKRLQVLMRHKHASTTQRHINSRPMLEDVTATYRTPELPRRAPR